MDSLSRVFTRQLSTIQDQGWDWARSCSDTEVIIPCLNRIVTGSVDCSKPGAEDSFVALPDELLEKIFLLLPITYVYRARAVSRRWNAIINSKRFSMVSDERGLYGPWYFMYKESQNSEGLAYDPLARKWHNFVLPFTLPTGGPVAASGGLVCFAENCNDYMLYLCNLMTRKLAKLPGPYEQCRSDYYAVSLNVDRVSKVQSIAVARSSRSSNDYSEWSFSVDTCSSHSQTWKNMVNTVLYGWRGGETSVICNGIFYCVTHSTAMVGNRHDECRLGLLYFDLQMEKLEIGTLPMPCPLTCVKLINCNGHLIMVGGIGKADVVRGIGIWELQAEWKEISRMPHKFFRGFGELDDVFSSSGADDLIYIHAYGSPQLLLFNIKQKSWRWSQKCPLVKKHPLHLFTGFCFQPSLHVAPWSN